jgi:uncharacterized membrane protein YeaQ/YmgE (transglycosylase-associated protein family)
LESCVTVPRGGAMLGRREAIQRMGILTWILLGIVVGALAKWLMPGKDPGGIVITMAIGIAGAVLGGFIAARLGLGGVVGFDLRSLAIAVAGAVLLLFVQGRLRA